VVVVLPLYLQTGRRFYTMKGHGGKLERVCSLGMVGSDVAVPPMSGPDAAEEDTNHGDEAMMGDAVLL
jgi:hypothetical protein